MLGRRIAAIGGVMLALGGVAASSAQADTGAAKAAPAPASAPAAAPTAVRTTTAATPTAATYASTVGFNGMFAMGLDPVTLGRELDGVAASGSHWLRVDFAWSGIEGAGRGHYSWAAADRLVAAANARGIHLLAMAAYTPAWNRPAGTTDHYQPTDPTAYAEFVRAAAARYAPLGLHAWEIWNEPNTNDFWQPAPNPARYTELLKLGSAAIRSADPDAFVVSAGVAPAVNSAGRSIAPEDFVSAMYAAGAGPSIDAVGLHPYSFPYAPTYPAQWNTFYITPQIHATMAAYGDGAKKIWGTEIGWATGTGSKAISESQQAAMVGQMISAWSQFSFGGNLFWYNWQDLSSDRSNVFDNMGVLRADGSAKPALAVFRTLLKSPVAIPKGGLPHRRRRGSSVPTRDSSPPERTRRRPAAGCRSTGPSPARRALRARTACGWSAATAASSRSAMRASTARPAPIHLNQPIVGMAPTRDGHGYYLVASDGGIFSFGNARFYGSTGAIHLNQPIVGMATTPSGHGYWMVASDGGIFSFGDARFYGSTGAMRLNKPIVALARSHSGHGYLMVASDGGMFTFGDSHFYGSTGGIRLATPVVGVASTTSGKGYWIASAGGAVYSFGDAGPARSVNGAVIVDAITP